MNEGIELGSWGSGLAGERWDGVRKSLGQLHGEASGAAWFPFKEGEWLCAAAAHSVAHGVCVHMHFGPFNLLFIFRKAA
jgi:hypothetical protein